MPNLDKRLSATETMAAEVGDLLTVAEAAAIVRGSLATIYQAVEEGDIADVIRLGGRRGIRIPVASFRDYVKSLRIAAQSSQPETGQLPEPAVA